MKALCIWIVVLTLIFLCHVFAEPALEGKTICIDPGHGGEEAGAVGLHGLTEKEVNLTVALKVRDLLKEAGATVIMTRDDDSSLSIPERRNIHIEQEADLFVSFHHNANSQIDRSINRTEVFYHWHDRDGPSEDAARLVYKELQAAYNLDESKPYLCWAYGLLREARYPAILGEASYISHPEEEQRLRDPGHLQAQAEAYFRGIKEFFRRGRPKIAWRPITADQPSNILIADISIPEGTALLDPQAVHIEIDHTLHDDYYLDYENKTLKIFADFECGQIVRVTVRNIAGNAAFPIEKKIDSSRFSSEPIKPKEQKTVFHPYFHEKTIILDPEGGGDDPVAIHPRGLRASDVNLRTAQYLKSYLHAAGANVLMTRQRDESRDNVARVRFGLQNEPDLFLIIGYRLSEPGLGEKPGTDITRIGTRWSASHKVAGSSIFHLREMLGTSPDSEKRRHREPLPGETHSWSSWQIMHAAKNYSATHFSPLMFDGPDAYERLSTAATPRKAALAMFYGVAEYLGMIEDEAGKITGIVITEGQHPIADALIFCNNNIVTQTESDGVFIFKFLPEGKNVLKISIQDKEPLKKEVLITEENRQKYLEITVP